LIVNKTAFKPLNSLQSAKRVNRTMAAAANYIRKSADVVGVAK
jgi:hypothetical protein